VSTARQPMKPLNCRRTLRAIVSLSRKQRAVCQSVCSNGRANKRHIYCQSAYLRIRQIYRPIQETHPQMIGERYRLNHAIVVQAACKAVVCGMMCFQAACLKTHLS